MNLKERINSDFMIAYKAKDMNKKTFLGILKGTLQTQETKEKPILSTDDNVLLLIRTIEKGLLETIAGRKKMGLDVSSEELELTYLKPYQPELMSEELVRTLVIGLIKESTNKNQGFLIGQFNKKFSSGALGFDNKLVGLILKEELENEN